MFDRNSRILLLLTSHVISTTRFLCDQVETLLDATKRGFRTKLHVAKEPDRFVSFTRIVGEA